MASNYESKTSEGLDIWGLPHPTEEKYKCVDPFHRYSSPMRQIKWIEAQIKYEYHCCTRPASQCKWLHVQVCGEKACEHWDSEKPLSSVCQKLQVWGREGQSICAYIEKIAIKTYRVGNGCSQKYLTKKTNTLINSRISSKEPNFAHSWPASLTWL